MNLSADYAAIEQEANFLRRVKFLPKPPAPKREGIERDKGGYGGGWCVVVCCE
jgi:hypothetical protein